MTFLLAGISRAEDLKLRDLQARLISAQSQMDLNFASGEIAEYLDQKLTEKETEIERHLDSDGLSLFKEAAKRWRQYRSAQASFEGDLFRGGSIRPQIENQTFSRLTEERLSSLLRIIEPQ